MSECGCAGRAALDNVANRDRDWVDSAGCSALLHVVTFRLFSTAEPVVAHSINAGIVVDPLKSRRVSGNHNIDPFWIRSIVS